jgi:hypothetical protein
VYGLGRRIGGDCATVCRRRGWRRAARRALYALEFIKQGIGLTLVATRPLAVLWALDAPTRWRVAVAVAALLAAALAHKTAAVIALVASVPPVYAAARARGWRPGCAIGPPGWPSPARSRCWAWRRRWLSSRRIAS